MSRKVVVVGGGLAGLYSAYSAAIYGANVELYEKSVIGAKHNCGELFTEVYLAAPEKCKLNKIDTFNILYDNTNYSLSFNNELTPFIMTDKSEHEIIIKEMCKRAGVDIVEKCAVDVSSLDDFVIDASGTSKYTGSMGKAVDYVVTKDMFDKYEINSVYLSVRNDLKGYSWRFPRGNEHINLGEGVYDYKQRVVFSKPLRKYIVNSGGGLLPMPTMNEYYAALMKCELGVIRVGNACGLVNPLLGGGEHLAVISGMLAGCLMAKKIESKYMFALNEIVGDEMRLGISYYELLKKQDAESIRMLFSNFADKKLDKNLMEKISNNTRKTISKWIPIPDVDEEEMIKFVGE